MELGMDLKQCNRHCPRCICRYLSVWIPISKIIWEFPILSRLLVSRMRQMTSLTLSSRIYVLVHAVRKSIKAIYTTYYSSIGLIGHRWIIIAIWRKIIVILLNLLMNKKSRKTDHVKYRLKDTFPGVFNGDVYFQNDGRTWSHQYSKAPFYLYSSIKPGHA